MAAAVAIPDYGLFSPEIRIGTTIRDGNTYFYTLWIRPFHLPEEIQSTVIYTVGERDRGGRTCLDISFEDVTLNIQNDRVHVYGIVENITVEDYGGSDIATGSLQYTDWTDGEKLWMNDLCRVKTADRPAPSTIKILIELFEEIAKGKGITSLHLFVDPHDSEHHKHDVLVKRYRDIYGFTRFVPVRPDEAVKDYIFMEKSLVPGAAAAAAAAAAGKGGAGRGGGGGAAPRIFITQTRSQKVAAAAAAAAAKGGGGRTTRRPHKRNRTTLRASRNTDRTASQKN